MCGAVSSPFVAVLFFWVMPHKQTALLNGLSVLSLETPLYPGLVASSLTQVRWEGSGGPSTAVVIGLHGAGESVVLGEQFFNLLACAQTLAAAVAV